MWTVENRTGVQKMIEERNSLMEEASRLEAALESILIEAGDCLCACCCRLQNLAQQALAPWPEPECEQAGGGS